MIQIKKISEEGTCKHIIILTGRSEKLNQQLRTFLMMQEKTFFIENQQTNKSELIKWEIPIYGAVVNLQKLFESIPEANKKIFKIYNPETDGYVQFTDNNLYMQPFTIPRHYLRLHVLMIKYSDNPDYEDDNYSQTSESQDDNKKERSRERSIRQVIELVGKWREFHDYPQDGKKRTLQEAARLVGVSKKSLDDYYYQLRVGQKHDFDFTSHLEDKIGVLRAFIKIKEPERKVEGKNSKHPKKLKIIEQFSRLRISENNSSSNEGKNQFNSLKPNTNEQDIRLKMQQKVDLNRSAELNVSSIHSQNEDQLFWGAPFTPLSQENYINCEKNFYNDFDFSLDDLGDPYLQFLPLNNLTSKKSDKSQDQF